MVRLNASVAILLLGLLPGTVLACENTINPTLAVSRIKTAAFDRLYTVTGCADKVLESGLPIVFGFHGGGEKVHDSEGTGFLDFTNLASLNALVIAPVGNPSNNGHSWINAFPWMHANPENDLDLPAALLSEVSSRTDLPKLDFHRVYAVGKSDGGGMAMALACHRAASLHLVGVALVSGAYFGLQSPVNFGVADHSICLPDASVRLMIMHGTGDQVMPFKGHNFLNPKALRRAQEYWASIDPAVTATSSNTYTADVERYVAAMRHDVYRCDGVRHDPLGKSSTLMMHTGCVSSFDFIMIQGGNHDWPGHGSSGP